MKNPKIIFRLIAILFFASLLLVYIQKHSRSGAVPLVNTFELQPVWRFGTQEVITSSPIGDNNKRIYIRTSNSIFVLDANNGDQLLHIESPSDTPLSTMPYVLNKYLITIERSSRIAVFNSDTGKLIWRSSVIDVALTHSVTSRIEAIAFDEDSIYVARFDWTFTSYSIRDGQIKWESDLSGRSASYLAVDEKAVYLGTGRLLKAFNKKSGALLWEKELEAYIGPILRIDNVLYVIDESHSSLYAIDLNNQEILWMNYYPEAEEFEFGCLSDYEDLLLISAQKLITVSKSNGQEVWSTEDLGRLECPTILNNKVFVRNTKDTLYAFDLNTGKETGRLKVSQNTSIKHEPNRSPISIAGLLIVPVSDNLIVAYGP